MQNNIQDIYPISKTVLTKATPLNSSLLFPIVDLGLMPIFRQLSIYIRLLRASFCPFLNVPVKHYDFLLSRIAN
jgi:hypothetical protein